MVEWVENIRHAPALDANTEEKLIAVMSQLIEQKFRGLTYKELSHMLRLRPLSETISGQELIKEERIALLIQLCQHKFVLSEELVAATSQQLQKLDTVTLEKLFNEILDFNTFEQLEQWITDQIKSASKPARKRTRRKS